jgi:hypothetical protein
MKKIAIVCGIAAVLVALSVTSVFAKYSTDVDTNANASGNNFVFTADETYSVNGAVKIAPGETQEVAGFKLSNLSESVANNVDVDVTTNVNFSLVKELPTGDSLTYAFYDHSGNLLNKSFTLGHTSSDRTLEVSLYITWKDSSIDGSSEQAALAGQNLGQYYLTFIGTQSK